MIMAYSTLETQILQQKSYNIKQYIFNTETQLPEKCVLLYALSTGSGLLLHELLHQVLLENDISISIDLVRRKHEVLYKSW